MKHSEITPRNTIFALVSFEGPDSYSMAGGLGVRMLHLSNTLAGLGFETHLFFIGDPSLPGEEIRENGNLVIHRWCQWISRYHPLGVYDGEEGKLADFNGSLPPYLVERIIVPASAADKLVVVLGEEWQAAEALCRLHDLLCSQKLRNGCIIFWNANNTFSFNRVNWARLDHAAVITTISRYMKHIMERMGLNPLVIPNGIPRSLLHGVDEVAADSLRETLGADILLCKVARWDPDKRWIEAVEAVAELKAMGLKTTLLARGGMESYGVDVIRKAQALRLSVKDALLDNGGKNSFAAAMAAAAPADIINIRFPLPLEFLTVMYRAADVVLANSGHEPFGIVGLEAMAAGGIVFTGSSGEDYAIPFVNSCMIDTPDPQEIVSYILYLKNNPDQMRQMRASAMFTARYYTWENAVRNLVRKLENQGRIQGVFSGQTYVPLTLPAGEGDWDDFDTGVNAMLAGEKASARRRCTS